MNIVEEVKQALQALGVLDHTEANEVQRLSVAREIREHRKEFRLLLEVQRELRGEATETRVLLAQLVEDNRAAWAQIMETTNMLSPEVQALHDQAKQATDLVQAVHLKQQALAQQISDLTAKLQAVPVAPAPGLSDEDKAALVGVGNDLATAVSTLTSDVGTNTPQAAAAAAPATAPAATPAAAAPAATSTPAATGDAAAAPAAPAAGAAPTA